MTDNYHTDVLHLTDQGTQALGEHINIAILDALIQDLESRNKELRDALEGMIILEIARASTIASAMQWRKTGVLPNDIDWTDQFNKSIAAYNNNKAPL